MAIVERPNQDALSRAINLYLDAIRPFLTRNLKRVSGRTVEEAISHSLPPKKAEEFEKNWPKADYPESTIEVSYVNHIIDHYWVEVFARYFRNRAGTLQNLDGVTRARHQVAHPVYQQDLDGIMTLKYLDALLYLLGAIGASEERKAVANIKAELENPGELDKERTDDLERLENRHQRAVVAHSETRASAARYRSERDLANGNWKKEETARKVAEKRVQDAEDSHRKTSEELRGEEMARKEAEERAAKTETQMTRRVAELDATSSKLKKEKAARREAEKKTQAAQASIRQSKEKLQREVEARREAEKRAAEEAQTRQLSEQTTLEMRTALDLTKKELSASGARLKKLQARIQEIETASQENAVFAQHELSDKPLNPRTAQYELWLIDEILSGRLDRASLRQLAGDDRLSGRLVYFVQAASSGMDGAAWNGYVTRRHKALLRNGNYKTL